MNKFETMPVTWETITPVEDFLVTALIGPKFSVPDRILFRFNGEPFFSLTPHQAMSLIIRLSEVYATLPTPGAAK